MDGLIFLGLILIFGNELFICVSTVDSQFLLCSTNGNTFSKQSVKWVVFEVFSLNFNYSTVLSYHIMYKKIHFFPQVRGLLVKK